MLRLKNIQSKMENKICVINQPAGIGDILYTLQIGHIIAQKGYRVIWPVIKQYSWIAEYISCDGVNLISEDSDFPMKELYNSVEKEIVYKHNLLYIPLKKSTLSELGSKYPLMLSKYGMVGLTKNSRDWSKILKLKRNFEKEKAVKAYYNSNSQNDYIFCNRMIGSPDGHLIKLKEMEMSIQNLKKKYAPSMIKENEFIVNTTIFDFMGILSEAKEIHVPNSALAWIAELLVLKGCTRKDQKRYCYPRDRGNPINDNWQYMKGCWQEHNWYFVKPQKHC